jgi:hypothetical protein
MTRMLAVTRNSRSAAKSPVVTGSDEEAARTRKPPDRPSPAPQPVTTEPHFIRGQAGSGAQGRLRPEHRSLRGSDSHPSPQIPSVTSRPSPGSRPGHGPGRHVRVPGFSEATLNAEGQCLCRGDHGLHRTGCCHPAKQLRMSALTLLPDRQPLRAGELQVRRHGMFADTA